MTGIAIFTAGREDAYDDYKETVKKGAPFDILANYLNSKDLDILRKCSESNTARLWCTQREGRWKNMQGGDCVVFYRNQKIIGRAKIIHKTENLPLAKKLWRSESNPWNDQSPWKYLVFFNNFKEVDIPIVAFNNLVGYKKDHIPHGVDRVADVRTAELARKFGNVKNALDILENEKNVDIR